MALLDSIGEEVYPISAEWAMSAPTGVCVCVCMCGEINMSKCERNSCNGCRESSIATAHADLREVEGDGAKAGLMSSPRTVHSYS